MTTDPLAVALPQGIALTELDATFRADPHSRLATLRSACPVLWDEQFGHFFVTSYTSVRAVLTDTTLWRDPAKAEENARLMRSLKVAPPGRDGRHSGRDSGMIFLDPPDHARVRNIIARVLLRRIAAARPLVEDIVHQQIRRLERQTRAELVVDFAIPIPIEVIASILGVEGAAFPQFRQWSESLIKIFHPAPSRRETLTLVKAGEALTDCLASIMNARRRAPRNDLISDLLIAKDSGADISEEEILHNCRSLLVAGNLSTSDLISNTIWLLLRNPSELARLRAEPRLIAAAVEEALRLESPIAITGRVASRNMQVADCPVRSASALQLSLLAANRDPAVYSDPDRYDVDRAEAPHLAFGGGEHFCLGAGLARLEAQSAVAALFSAFPQMTLVDREIAPKWRELPFAHGLSELHASLTMR